jgi:HAMP domain-containing protein
MGLATKFNLILIPVLALGFYVLSTLTHTTLQENAKVDIVTRAGLMMGSAGAVRAYTVEEIKPLLVTQLRHKFLPQSVPAYAATQAFMRLQKHNPDYSYKEATLNPTNPVNRAVDWESDVIQMFRNNDKLDEFAGVRDTPGGRSQFLARPIRITNPDCLTCHSLPQNAPATMLKQYGRANGFGWQINEVVGAQIVSVPMEVAIHQADSAYRSFMTVLSIVFVAIIVLANLFLHFLVVRPIRRMSKTAEQLSTGDMSAPEFTERGHDEVSVLAASFNRMRRSLDNAMKLIEEQA